MLGENIKNLRIKQGLSQNELADMIHVVRQTISSWELDKSAPNTEQLKKLSEIFGTDISTIVGMPIAKDTSEEQIASILGGINEQFAILNKTRRINTLIIAGILILVFLLIAASLFFNWLS